MRIDAANPDRRAAHAFLAASAIFAAAAAACACMGAEKDVFDRWETMQGKVVPIRQIESIPKEFWIPLPAEGAAVLFSLGPLRVAVPDEDGMTVTEGRKKTQVKLGTSKAFQGTYIGRIPGMAPLAVRRGTKGFEFAVAAYVKVRLLADVFCFVDADGNGVFTEYGVDLMVRGDLGKLIEAREKERLEREKESGRDEGGGIEGGGEEETARPPIPDCAAVPGDVTIGKQRYLLASEFPSTLLLCPVDESVPLHAGPHNGYLNLVRSHGGYGPAGISMRIYDAQVSHCRYMAKNGICHAEDPSKPGYTPEGSKAGESSVCGHGSSAEDALLHMITTLYHSYDFLAPKVRTVCYAFDAGLYSCNVDADAPADFLVYPFPGQDKVNPKGSGESPDPYPPGAARPGGTFIRILPPNGQKGLLQSFSITDLLTGRKVNALFTDPTCIPKAVSAYNYDYMLRTICLFPDDALQPGRIYRAEAVVATGKKSTRTIETTFRTR